MEILIRTEFAKSTPETIARQEVALLLTELAKLNVNVSEKGADIAEYNHWLESAGIVFAIVASSVAVIDTIKNWLKEKKEQEVESKVEIFIIVENKTFNIKEEYGEVLNLLDKFPRKAV